MTLTAPKAHIAITQDGVRASSEYLRFFFDLTSMLQTGVTVTVPLAKLTGGGADGSLTFVNGLLTAATAPT
jgi:hypothetical protein